jgi:hypothetical protein
MEDGNAQGYEKQGEAMLCGHHFQPGLQDFQD